MQDVRCLLCSEDDDMQVINSIQGHLIVTEERLAEGRAVLFHLQTQLMNVACIDPGAIVGEQLALPILQVACACLNKFCCGRLESVALPGFRWRGQAPHPPLAGCIAELSHCRA